MRHMAYYYFFLKARFVKRKTNKNIFVFHTFMMTYYLMSSVFSLTIRCRQILHTAPLKALLVLLTGLMTFALQGSGEGT